jgi:hypothetical protein
LGIVVTTGQSEKTHALLPDRKQGVYFCRKKTPKTALRLTAGAFGAVLMCVARIKPEQSKSTHDRFRMPLFRVIACIMPTHLTLQRIWKNFYPEPGKVATLFCGSPLPAPTPPDGRQRFALRPPEQCKVNLL